MTCGLYIVDDDDAVRASLQAMLSVRFACAARGFASGDAFLRGVADLDPGVLVVDVDMPGASGIDVLRAVVPYGSRFVSLILTGQGSVSVAVEAMKANASDFLEKPPEPAKLIAAVAAAMACVEHHQAAADCRELARTSVARLSCREAEVLAGLIHGCPNKQIAHDLHLSPRTVEIYRANLMNKLGVRNLSDVLRIAFTAGLVPAE